MAKAADDSGTHVWLILMKAHGALVRHAEGSLDSAGVGFSEFAILEALLHKGAQLVSQLGRRIHLTSGAMTSAIDRLEARGLVRRDADDLDRRARVVSLTARGRKLITKKFAEHKARMDASADALSPSERASLIALLRKLGTAAERKLDSSAPSRP
jgi:MarR family 2-MHQ and catechol resistance regulon transcriptional repressor